jgi:hypothetical protein
MYGYYKGPRSMHGYIEGNICKGSLGSEEAQLARMTSFERNLLERQSKSLLSN